MEKKKLYPINYLGKTYNTTIHRDLTDEEWQDVIKEYYTKPSFESVQNELMKIHNGGTNCSLITRYYVKDLMAKVKIYYNNWTIEEALNHKPLVEFFAGKTDVNEKVFSKTNTLCQNIEAAFRLCGFKTASKPANYPMKSVDKILEEFNINNVYYDFSCGWGTRLLSALKHNITYLGTDPNYLLTERLIQIANDYNKTNKTYRKFDIRSTGSEVLHEDWIGKVGVAFTSPPYFYLEDYKIGNQSYKEGTCYDDWKNNYLKPTIHNIYQYLIPGGTMIINIKNFDSYDLESDTIDIANLEGFVLDQILNLKNNHRCYGVVGNKEKAGFNNNDENIYVFKRKEDIDNNVKVSAFQQCQSLW